MPQLDPTWFASQLFWLLVSFAALYVLLSRVFLPPLMAIMAKRRETVDTDLSLAQGLKGEAETARQLYEKALADARAKSQALLLEAQAQQKHAADEAARATEEQVAAKLREAELAINRKRMELKDSLTPVAAELTAMVVEKLLRQHADMQKVSSALNLASKTGR
jgi:F-type H+-transporting ATPase subunit b